MIYSASGQLAGWEVKTYELFPPLPYYPAEVSGVHDIPRSQQLPLLSCCHNESSYFLLSRLFYEHFFHHQALPLSLNFMIRFLTSLAKVVSLQLDQ